MRLRLIILLLSLLAFLSASTGGYLYYSLLKEAAVKDAEKQAVTRTEMIKKHLSSLLSENIKPVQVLAGLEDIHQALSNPGAESLNRANIMLDHFHSVLNADVCYLTDRNGNTIASSNRGNPDSFVGENFQFRPYFQDSIKGNPGKYLAMGKTSGKRGAYYSYPVYAGKGEKPAGIAVIKASIEGIEKELSLEKGEIILLTAPLRVVFISSRQEWLYHLLWKSSNDETALIAESRQFGDGPWQWTGLEVKDKRYVSDKQNNRYLMHQTEMDGYEGWNVFHLQDLKIISKKVSEPFIRVSGMIILVLCFFLGFIVAILYINAAREIALREEAEEALRLAKEELSWYSKDLERQVAERTREITGILRYTPDFVYIKDIKQRYVLVNSRYEELLGVKNEDIRGKTAHECMPKEIADYFQISDKQVISEKRSCRVEHTIPHKDGFHTYLSVKFPIYDESGEMSAVGGISTDITELKKAQEQLRRLSGSIINSQEKERAAIARELHDELGQILTALRMDAVWISNRLKDKDEKAFERAYSMQSLIDKTIDDVRSIAIRLRPGVLDDLGLVDALEWYTADFERRTEITCTFEHKDVPFIRNTIATAAYRIAQEALTNVARHAHAANASLFLGAEDHILKLSVTDDGCGFDPSSLTESQGLGLAGMKERAGILGGILEVETLPGEGTRVCFELKMEKEEAYD